MKQKILGDFQTPLALAEQVVHILKQRGTHWTRVLEPTCGLGNFIHAVIQQCPDIQEIIGIEIQEVYVQQAVSIPSSAAQPHILHQSIFDIDILRDIAWVSSGHLLIIGNPPWVTNAMQGALEADNLPVKTNLKQLKGIDAITGKANFDIAEFIWIKLLHDLRDTPATIAFLCKTSVARNVLNYAHQCRLPISKADMYMIDAKKWFNAAVDACLFVVDINQAVADYFANMFDNLTDEQPRTKMGFIQNQLIANINDFETFRFMHGQSDFEWRQGVKHDAAKVMELQRVGDTWQNHYGEIVDIENEYIYPLIKSSYVKPHYAAQFEQGVIITQNHPGQDTAHLKTTAPRLWQYLTKHQTIFSARKSSIYRNHAAFSMFGIGDYTFASYKVMVSGFYKTPYFLPVMPIKQRPVVCDDTCYLLPFDDPLLVVLLAAALNHPDTLRFLKSIVFEDSKRPITKTILNQLNLQMILQHIPLNDLNQIAATFVLPNIVIPASKEEILRLFFPHLRQLTLF